MYNGPCAKKKFGLGRPLKALRPLEGPGEARDHQGPPGINAVVKRNCLSQKKNFGLGRPLMASRPLEGSRGAGHHQGPSGIDAGVKRNHLSQKKIWPRPAFDGLWRPPEAGIRMPHPKLSLTLHKLSIGTHIYGVGASAHIL